MVLAVASLSGARRSESQQCSLSRVTGMPAVASSVEENRVSDELIEQHDELHKVEARQSLSRR